MNVFKFIPMFLYFLYFCMLWGAKLWYVMVIRQNDAFFVDGWILVPFNCSFLEFPLIMYAEVSILVFAMRSLMV